MYLYKASQMQQQGVSETTVLPYRCNCGLDIPVEQCDIIYSSSASLQTVNDQVLILSLNALL